MKYFRLTFLLAMIAISCSTRDRPAESADTVENPMENWPTTGWQYDTLNDNSSFAHMVDSFPGKYSLLIVRNGKIAFEHYQEPYAKDSLIHVNSCTKTVISVLFGSVFKEQLDFNENRSAIDFFPEYAINDSLIQRIKVKHFLSMSSGLHWRGGIDAFDVIQMSETNDWAKYVFKREVSVLPGEEFLYNSGGTQVVSTILNKQVEGGLMAFAQDNLFNPLGISELKWDSTSKGVPKAGWGLHLKIQDMVKLGYLLLKKGKWEDMQVVPEQWVSKMSSSQINANSKYNYGYQTWIPKNMGTECIMFRGGYPPSIKVIAVLPELNAVVTYVGENHNFNDLLREVIVPELKE